ncbi:GNAT superfamily N-acetyltransferase [Nocardioides daedukensis]|uniref:GNAT superfamily N-acetyltransferase n=1 Tax=Nocardioides daedukensis TaxID=634462 RepID=A0A7Y9UTE0_9ACTN|nr:GNAT family N-acetyltransferase [Nocardioides daedukensis]NYG57959.1 GNAT superfamily N-acetyltransferase [Nocardioides daedukensis]
MSSALILRPAVTDDLPAIAELHIRARAAAVPSMPPLVHPRDAVVAWVRGWDLSATDVWVAEADQIVGYLALTPTWLDALYVDPAAQRGGIGTALLEVATSLRPDGFGLWVFESNHPARSFYHKHGLVELERTDGADNEERSPDIRMAWLGEQPLVFLRNQIDEVDDQLAGLLARRQALTAAVQVRKPVGGHAGRDPQREREIRRANDGQGAGIGTGASGPDRGCGDHRESGRLTAGRLRELSVGRRSLDPDIT